jgi:hypothetical protein
MPTADLDTWSQLAAAGGRLLSDLCDGHGAYMEDLYRFDYPAGGRAYLCRNCWSLTYIRLGQPGQPLLAAHT